MSLERELQKRSDSKCELCNSEEQLNVYLVAKQGTAVRRISLDHDKKRIILKAKLMANIL